MSSIKLESNSSGTGVFTVASPNSNTNRTLTLPDSTGTVVVTGGAQTIEFAAGSASTPSITTTGDTNTGIFFPAADTIAFGEGGAEAMRIDSSGNVMIGTTSQNGKLTVVMPTGSGSLGIQTGSITADSTRLQSGGSVNNWLEYRGYLGHAWFVDATERMRIDSSGNVGIGSTSPSTYVDASTSLVIQASSGRSGLTLVSNQTVANEILGRISFTDSGSTNTSYRNAIIDGVRGSDDNSAYLTFSTSNSGNPAERMRITTGGEVYIAGTTDQGAYNLQCNGTGVWGAGAYVNGSDARIKDDIAPIESGLDVVEKLNPVTYRYKEDWLKDQSTQTGFIAQELLVALEGKNYVDGVVQQGGAEGYYSVAYQNIIPILTKAIQELKAELDTTKARLAALEAK